METKYDFIICLGGTVNPIVETLVNFLKTQFGEKTVYDCTGSNGVNIIYDQYIKFKDLLEDKPLNKKIIYLYFQTDILIETFTNQFKELPKNVEMVETFIKRELRD